MKKAQVILHTLLILVGLCNAQEELSVLSADRPGYTWGAEALSLHKVSWENGFGFESSHDETHTMTLNSTIVRYGIFKNMQLCFGTDSLMFNDGQAKELTFAFALLTVGTKLKVYESTNWLPSIGLLAEFKSPHIGSKELLSSHLVLSIYALFEHSINYWLSPCYNVGLEWDEETASPQTFLALALGFNITDNIRTSIETYNYIYPEENQYMTEFGLTWMVADFSLTSSTTSTSSTWGNIALLVAGCLE